MPVILRAVEIEVSLRRAGDVNPLIVGDTKYQGTNVPRSPQFSPREVESRDFERLNMIPERVKPASKSGGNYQRGQPPLVFRQETNSFRGRRS